MVEAALGTARAFLALSSASHEYVMSEITQASAEEIAKPAGVVPSVLVPIAQAAARRIHGELFDEATRDVVATIVEDLVRERRAEWVKLSRPK